MNNLTVSIFSWNIGDIKDTDKIDRLLSSALITSTDTYPDIFVFGFQEYHIPPFNININDKIIFNCILNSINTKNKGNYKILGSKSACTSVSSFETMLLILIKDEYTPNDILKKSECLSSKGDQTFLIGTKGYEFIKFTLKGNECIFVNAHFPFQNEDTLNNFYNSLQEFINSNKTDNSLLFIFGDVNSRCLLTNEYKKDVFNCKNDNEFKDWCSIKGQLEQIDFNNTHYFHDYKNQIKDTKLINDLKSTDYYIRKTNESLFFKDKFREGEIHFLPTYKRDPNSGFFSLFKNEKSLTRTFTRTLSTLSNNNNSLTKEQDKNDNDTVGRLPGYADRIFFKAPDNKSIQCLKYGSLGITGNDHLPIGGHYLITDKTTDKTTGGRPRTRSKKSRSRSKKSRSRSKKSRSKGKK